jgi:flagellar biosynthesis GTPase FlhF
MNPSSITLEYIRENVVILENNYIYRISDSVRCNFNHKINKEILENAKYKDTILQNNLLKRKKNDANKNNLIYDDIIEYANKHNIHGYNENYIVVHLRCGDIGDRLKSMYNRIYNEINSYIKQNAKIHKIVIVTALHYGQPTISNNFYGKGKYSYTDQSVEQNIKILHEFIQKLKLPVIIHSSENIDIDTCKLLCSKNVIFSNGGFGTLLKTLNCRYNNKAPPKNMNTPPPLKTSKPIQGNEQLVVKRQEEQQRKQQEEQKRKQQEEQKRKQQEEQKRKQQEEQKRKQQEEQKRKQQEEQKRKQQEEQKRKQQEEQKRKQQEEQRKQQEEQRKQQEQKRKQQEQKRKQQEEQEEQRKQQEEEQENIQLKSNEIQYRKFVMRRNNRGRSKIFKMQLR